MEQTQEQFLDISKDTPAVVENTELYKQNLKQLPEVEQLTSEINVMDSNSILQFGQSPSEGISKMSDQLLFPYHHICEKVCQYYLLFY